VDPAERFAEPLARLEGWGYLGGEGDWLQIDRAGLLQIDRLLPEFFLPEHRTARYT
jgi:oxygen-independent coproporphyrinogen-3 oxidase